MSEMWTAKLRNKWQKNLPIEKLLPDDQPSYVASWIYVFGVLTLSALAMIIASGIILAFEGPAWYHTSDAGKFVNSLHFWSVQMFFVFMVIHLWGKYWMAAWRGNRFRTWATGAIAFVASIATAFTGRYPGQAWLWLYSFWYQIPPFNNEESKPIGANADAYIMAIMGVLSLGLILIPVIPGIKTLPMRIPIHRGIWRDYYRSQAIRKPKK